MRDSILFFRLGQKIALIASQSSVGEHSWSPSACARVCFEFNVVMLTPLQILALGSPP
jgi:hypothetical protein